jgi:6-pyruvoyltetrahydropterin/6-carboxytetrahydropterin synthase
MIEISKDFEFEAAHSLPHLPHTHTCHNLHGHSYKVRVTCSGEIDPVLGWVIDYGDISAAMQPILIALDHTNIDVLFRGALNPERKCKSEERRDKPSTAENLCIWLYGQLKPTLPSLVAVEVKETASTNVVYRP